MICPRRCGIDRQTARGFCGVGEEMRIVRVMRHSFEEPCIAGEHGAGAIFFTGCNLGCVFCQNAPISHPAAGHEPGDTVSPRRLADIMLELQAAGLSSVDLVTPTHFTPRIAEALRLARMDGLSLPVVWNSGGYELTETLAVLDGLIDVYMPDFKYFSPAISQKYSAAADYADRAAECIGYMYRVARRGAFWGRHDDARCARAASCASRLPPRLGRCSATVGRNGAARRDKDQPHEPVFARVLPRERPLAAAARHVV